MSREGEVMSDYRIQVVCGHAVRTRRDGETGDSRTDDLVAAGAYKQEGSSYPASRWVNVGCMRRRG